MNDTAVTDVGATNPTILFFYAKFTNIIMKKEVSEACRNSSMLKNTTFLME